MALTDGDLPGVLDDLGVDVTIGYVTVKGIKRRFTEEMFTGNESTDLMSRSIVVSIQTDSLPGLENGATVTVGGTAYKVRRHSEAEHGSLTRIHCVRVA
jgi:hypothetical protein